MKRILSTFLLCAAFITTHAQSGLGQEEVSIGVGRLSAQDISHYGYNPDASRVNRQDLPIYSASYQFYLSNKCAVGIGIAQHSYAYEFYHYYENRWESYFYDAVSICIDAKTVYINKHGFQFYGTWSLGYFYAKGNYNNNDRFSVNSVSVYLAPLGLRFGEKVGFFVESGIGYKGLIHGGISYKFGEARDGWR